MKHIFDYAEEHNQPCVISYSIGFDYIPDDAELYREALQGVQGPGKIIVVSAGNSNIRRHLQLREFSFYL